MLKYIKFLNTFRNQIQILHFCERNSQDSQIDWPDGVILKYYKKQFD